MDKLIVIWITYVKVIFVYNFWMIKKLCGYDLNNLNMISWSHLKRLDPIGLEVCPIRKNNHLSYTKMQNCKKREKNRKCLKSLFKFDKVRKKNWNNWIDLDSQIKYKIQNVAIWKSALYIHNKWKNREKS